MSQTNKKLKVKERDGEQANNCTDILCWSKIDSKNERFLTRTKLRMQTYSVNINNEESLKFSFTSTSIKTRRQIVAMWFNTVR